MTNPALAPPLAVERYRALEPHLIDGVSLAALARTGVASERTLQRWLRCYRVEGLAGLGRSLRSDRGKVRMPDHLAALVRELATKRPRPPVSAIHRKVTALAVAEGREAPSYSSVARIIGSVPESRIAAATDPAAYRDHHELVHRREASASNEMWQADHTVLDIFVLDDAGELVRPWLSVVLDDHSRAIAGYFISLDAPSALNTALALRHAIWRKANPEWIVSGIPEQLYVDNGADFVSEHVEQACMALRIRLTHSLPGRPRGRGKIERLFRTVNDMFLPDLPGHLIRGKPLSMPALSLDELRARFEAFVCGVYHPRLHGSTGEAPVARWQKGGFLPAMPDSLDQLDMLLVHVPKPRKVLRDGIRLLGRRYVEPTLAAFVGEKVMVLYDPRDLTEVHVYHEGRFVCRALSPEHLAAPSLRDIQRARRDAKRRDLDEPFIMEAGDGDQAGPGSPDPSPSGGSGSTPLTIELPVEQPFLPTREHARFVEFAEACSRYRYIGVCHGRPGVGKTRSAREFASFPDLRGYGACNVIGPALAEKVTRCKAIFYTAGVSNTPKTIDAGLCVNVTKLGYARLTVAAGSPEGVDIDKAQLACPLVIVDEADRLSIKSLEELRDLSDRYRFGLVLMGMPGLEKRLARYAQFYSRIGFVHEFKPLTETEMRLLLVTHAADFGIGFDPALLDAIEAQAAVIRITRGNFRLMERLFAQMRRIMTLNRVEEVTADIVQAARDCLVIGPSN